MNIKKIIRETVDDFNWVMNTGYDINNPQPGMRFTLGSGITVYKIESVDHDTGKMVISFYDDEENYWEELEWSIKGYNFYLERNAINLILTNMNESQDEWDWVDYTEPKSFSLEDDELHKLFYLARKAELISNLISGNVYIKIEHPEKLNDLERIFFDLGYNTFSGDQKVSKHWGLNNFWRKGGYLVIYNNGVTNKVIEYRKKEELTNIRKGSDFSLKL